MNNFQRVHRYLTEAAHKDPEGRVYPKECGEDLKIGYTQISQHIRALADEGSMVREGWGNGVKWFLKVGDDGKPIEK